MKTALLVVVSLLALVCAPSALAAESSEAEPPLDIILDCGPAISSYCQAIITACRLFFGPTYCDIVE